MDLACNCVNGNKMWISIAVKTEDGNQTITNGVNGIYSEVELL